MVVKMIHKTKIEIVIIIIFIIISIPIWIFLNQQLKENYTLTLENATKLELIKNNVDGYDNIIVDNGYAIDQAYELLLYTNQDAHTPIIINGQTYELNEFTKRKEGNLNIYVLAKDTIFKARKGYKIDLDLDNNTIYYYDLVQLT